MTAHELETLLKTHHISNIEHMGNNRIEVTVIDNGQDKNSRILVLNDRMVWVKQWVESISNSEL